jgi:signal transduction histidine kinase
MGPDDPLRPALEAIDRQSRRCAALVNTLLDFSRTGTEGAREVIRVDVLLEQVADLTAVRLGDRGVALDVERTPPGTPLLSVSRPEIESALLNLVDNAIDASARGAIIKLGAAPALRDGRRGVTIHVSDSGVGMTQDTVARIFDPFFTTKPVGKGTGLGLSLARQFVEGHGGRLSAESRLGVGTTMLLWLPAVDEAAQGRPP